MPSYNIVVSIDPTKADQGVKVVEGSLQRAGRSVTAFNAAVQRAFDFNTAPAVSATTAVDKAMEGVATSATAAGTAATSAMKKTGDAAQQANNKITSSAKQAQQGTLILGEQFRQFSTEVLAGVSPIQAFAQQAGQAAFGLQFMGGTAGTVGRFLAGPWGTLILVGVTVLANLAAEFLHTSNNSDEAEKALKRFQDRENDMANFIDRTTGKLVAQAGAFALIARNAKAAQIAEEQQKATQSRKDAMDLVNSYGAQGRSTFREGATGSAGDKDVNAAITAANGDINKLSTTLTRLALTSRPDLKDLATKFTNLAGSALTSDQEVRKLRGEMTDLNTVLHGGTVETTAMINRQVQLATATTDVERARARLSDVEARAASIDHMVSGPEKSAALQQYRKDLTDATKAVKDAEQAQKDARKAAAEHNKELREQQAAARKAAEELKREGQFIQELNIQNDKLETRGIQGAVNQKIDEFRNRFQKNPTADQKAEIETAVKRNQLLTDENSILDNLRGPLETYQRQIAALKDLLDKGKISQDEFNNSLADLPLKQALNSVDQQLTSTLTGYQAQVQQIDDTVRKALAVVDQAEKAGIINKQQAATRRDEIDGIGRPEGMITNGKGPTTLRDRLLADLDRKRRDDLNSFDQGLGGKFEEQAKKDAIDNQYADDLQKLRDFYNQKYITDQEYAQRKAALDKRVHDQQRDFELAQKDLALSSASETFQSLADMAEAFGGKQSAVYKAMFAVSKAFAIADSIVKIQQGIANALSLPFPANLAAVASVAAQAASIVANIQAVTLAFADGGYVSGPGGPRDDKINARLSNGEFVVNAEATRNNRALLEAINSGGKPVAGGTGGGGDTLVVQIGDVHVHNPQGDGEQIGKQVKGELVKLVDERIRHAKRPGGMLTRTNSSVMAGQ